MSKKDSFLVNRLKSVGIAAKGALLLIKNEASIKVQVMVSILVTCAGFYFRYFKNRVAHSATSNWDGPSYRIHKQRRRRNC